MSILIRIHVNTVRYVHCHAFVPLVDCSLEARRSSWWLSAQSRVVDSIRSQCPSVGYWRTFPALRNGSRIHLESPQGSVYVVLHLWLKPHLFSPHWSSPWCHIQPSALQANHFHTSVPFLPDLDDGTVLCSVLCHVQPWRSTAELAPVKWKGLTLCICLHICNGLNLQNYEYTHYYLIIMSVWWQHGPDHPILCIMHAWMCIWLITSAHTLMLCPWILMLALRFLDSLILRLIAVVIIWMWHGSLSIHYHTGECKWTLHSMIRCKMAGMRCFVVSMQVADIEFEWRIVPTSTSLLCPRHHYVI